MGNRQGKGRVHFERVNLNKLVRDNFQMLRTVISRNISVDFQLADNLPWIEADEGQIQQVLMNLITNASEAVGKQPGLITIATTVETCDQTRLENSRIETKPPPGLFVRLTVSDTGAGMDADTRERIFEPFFTTKFMGRGLGMAATLGIVRGHGGAIMLKSEPLQGTCFEVFFPASSATGPPPQSSGSPNTDATNPAMATGPILIVDDEAPVREFLTEALHQLGYQTLSAGDGLEAVTLFRRKSDEIACIVLDLTMPIMGGVAAFNEFQRIKPGIKVILSSGFSTENVVTQFSHQKPQGFLQKPFQIDALKKEINRVLLQGDSSEEA